MQTGLVHRVRAAVRGIASVEFALVTSVIAVIVLCTYDIGSFVLQQTKMTEAAHVGTQYAVSYPLDATGLTCAIEGVFCPNVTYSSLGGGCVGATCTLPTITVSAPSVTGTWPNSQVLITITVTQPFSPFLLSFLTSTSASYVARVQ